MILSTIIPFILVLIIIVVIYKLVNVIKKVPFLQKLNLKWMFSIYGVLLLVAIGLFYVLPIERSSNKIVDNQDKLVKVEKARQLLTMAASEGKQISKEKIDGVEIKNQWDFTYGEKQLDVTIADEQLGTLFTLVERKNVNDDRVEVIQYHTRTIIENLDLTDEIRPLTLELVEGELLIRDTNAVDIHLGKFAKEFTISQFTEEKGIEASFIDEDHIWAENVLYIRVPKDIEIEGDFQFVTQ
jgi:energy-coupling factor transporter transmembrane protein EcfT